MQTSPSGSVPFGQRALCALALAIGVIAVDSEVPAGPVPRTSTRRSGPTVSAETPTSSAASAPARTSVDKGRA